MIGLAMEMSAKRSSSRWLFEHIENCVGPAAALGGDEAVDWAYPCMKVFNWVEADALGRTVVLEVVDRVDLKPP